MRTACFLILTLQLLSLVADAQSEIATPVIVAPVIEAEVNSGYRIVGTVSPLRITTIGAGAGGRVAQFLVDEGQQIQAGQTIAQLQTETLQIELRAARAELELYTQQLAESVNGARAEDLAEAKANADGARAAMEAASTQLRRLQSLASTGASTVADLDSARERADLTKSGYAAASAMLARLQTGPRQEQIAQRQAQVELQKQKMLLIQDRIEKHTIVAPFSGFVSAEYTEVGAWISSGDPIVQLIELDEVEIKLPVTADYITRLRMGDQVRVEFPQFPDKLLIGTINRMVPFADARARTYPVFVRMKNEINSGVPLLLAGMLARVDLPAGAARPLPLVPKDALVLSEGNRSVFIVEPDRENADEGIVREVKVELGVATGNLIQVAGKLKAGQIVVVVGNERLVPGRRVAIRFDKKKPIVDD